MNERGLIYEQGMGNTLLKKRLYTPLNLIRIIWKPLPKQSLFIKTPIKKLLIILIKIIELYCKTKFSKVTIRQNEGAWQGHTDNYLIGLITLGSWYGE